MTVKEMGPVGASSPALLYGLRFLLISIRLYATNHVLVPFFCGDAGLYEFAIGLTSRRMSSLGIEKPRQLAPAEPFLHGSGANAHS